VEIEVDEDMKEDLKGVSDKIYRVLFAQGWRGVCHEMNHCSSTII
jgi:hypothetical protein